MSRLFPENIVVGHAMRSVLRIRRARHGLIDVSGSTELEGDPYQARLLKLIPAEAVGLYLSGRGMLPIGQIVPWVLWVLVCMFFVVSYRAMATRDRALALPPDWSHVAISTVAFLIWVFAIGDSAFDQHFRARWIASLLVLTWTVFTPVFYQGEGDSRAPGRE